MQVENGDLIEQLEAGRERFLSFVQRKVAEPEAAEEILQDAMLRALEGMDALRNDDRLFAWFYVILRNEVTDYYRRRARERNQLREIPEDIEAEAEPDYGALCTCFEPLIETLKPEYADLIRSLDLQKEAPEQAASRLGVTANNLKVRRHRARRALRKRLEETCRVCAEHHCLDCTCSQPALPGSQPTSG